MPSRTQGILGIALIASLCLFTAACSDEGGSAPPWAGGPRGGGAPGGGGPIPTGSEAIVGTWDVTTTLVAAQKATNPDYKPGHIRKERWQIAQSGGQLVLTTPNGSLPGQAQGGGYAFEGVTDTGMNLRIRVRVEAWLTGSRSMKGTIKAWYHGTFNNLGGIDAWSFEATR